MDENQYAFPVLTFHDEYDDEKGRYVPVPHMEGGLTKREYFAGLLLQGVCSSSSAWKQDWHADEFAKTAIVLADALIAELAKERK